MMAVIIFGVSLLTLLQFFVSYSRSLIASSREFNLSAEALEICGFNSRTATGEHFGRLLQLISLCPEPGGDSAEVQVVALYFRLLGVACSLLSWAVPSVAPWIEAERGGCSYAAAVLLDRRIAYGRMMMAQQTSR